MGRHSSLILASVIMFCLDVGLHGEPGEPTDPPKRTHVPVRFFDIGAEFPSLYKRATDAEPNGLSLSRETLFGTYAFKERGTVYSVEFYYRKLYERLRLRVLAGQREMHGPFNRVYGIDPGREFMFWVSRLDGYSTELTFNHGSVRLEESLIDMDVIYDTIEAFLGRFPRSDPSATVHLRESPGLLKKTCWVGIFGLSSGVDYLINEQGQVDPLTLESLRVAYNREQIKAQSPVDYERIGRSLIVAENNAIAQCKIIVVSRAEDIPGYRSHPLDAQNEAQIKPAWFRTDADTATDYWTCFTYRAYHGVVARFTFGFQHGNLGSAEKVIVGEGIGNAYYYSGESRSMTDRSGASPRVGESWQAPARDGSAQAGQNLIPMSLCRAVRVADMAQIRSLIASGSTVNAKERYGYTPLHYAAWDGHKEVAELLVAQGADVTAQTWVGDAALHCAAERGQNDIAELLLTNGAGVNAKGHHGRTPLHHAARLGNRQLVELLLAKGADVEARDKSDCVPLHGAARQDTTDIAATLISCGAKVNSRDNSRLTPLHIAVEGGHKDVAEFLIARGADVNALGGGGTPLHSAVDGGYKDLVELLLAKGADVSIKNEERETVIDLAQRTQQTAILEILAAPR